jgi:UDP-N-acetylglucosamine--N-acetylmuramyl-(pentapeptide) pyrophosphoryl-undecaprenol N-acetylglucosamine transferase
LAAAEAIRQRHPAVELIFVGSVDGFERPLLQDATFKFDQYDAVRSGPLHGVNPLKMANSAAQISAGTTQAIRLMRRYQPKALLLTGGWVSLPIALAAKTCRVPILIYLPDIEPGMAILRLAPLATAIATTVGDSRPFFAVRDREKVVVTGYPIRAEMRATATGEPPQPRHVLVFGGSRGARTINEAVIAIAPQLIAEGFSFTHVTGTLDWDSLRPEIEAIGAQHYHAVPYLQGDAMGAAMARASLAVCRSGASTLGELPLYGLPSILVPYPYAWRYQKVNADWLADRGAAVVMADADMGRYLAGTIRTLMRDPAVLEKMRGAARALAAPDGAFSEDGAWNVGRELLRLAGVE